MGQMIKMYFIKAGKLQQYFFKILFQIFGIYIKATYLCITTTLINNKNINIMSISSSPSSWHIFETFKTTNTEIIFSIEHDETQKIKRLHVCHDVIIDAYANCGIELNSINQIDDPMEIAQDIFVDYKEACTAGKEDDFSGVYVTDIKKPVIVFTMVNTIICEEYIIPNKGQSNAMLNEIAHEIGASSFKRAVQ